MNQTSRLPFSFALGLTLALTVAGCATAGGGGGASAGDALYREDLGRVMVAPLITAREKIWGRHTIPLYREETTARSIYWESEWLPRLPAPEETLGGTIGGRNRVVMRGTQAGENLDGTFIFRVRFEVQNQVQTQVFPEWHPAPMPPEVRERFKQVYDDLMLELRTGLIR